MRWCCVHVDQPQFALGGLDGRIEKTQNVWAAERPSVRADFVPAKHGLVTVDHHVRVAIEQWTHTLDEVGGRFLKEDDVSTGVGRLGNNKLRVGGAEENVVRVEDGAARVVASNAALGAWRGRAGRSHGDDANRCDGDRNEQHLVLEACEYDR